MTIKLSSNWTAGTFPFVVAVSNSDHNKVGSVFDWSFGPNCACGSIEPVTNGKTHPSLVRFHEILSGFSGLRENIFPSPVIYRPKCGVCGRHTILNGDLSAVINFGARSIRHSSLLDSTFTERVSVSSNGTVLVEAGMPKQEPEMVSQSFQP